MPCDLYRFFDSEDRLLYVGISKDLLTRWRNHSQSKDWWPKVTRATIEHFDSRRGAEEAEVRAITNENPVHNIKDAPQRENITAAMVTQYASTQPAKNRVELTPAKAAAILGISAPTVRRWEARGILRPCRRLPGSRHRRYSSAEVEALRNLIQDPAERAKLMAGSAEDAAVDL